MATGTESYRAALRLIHDRSALERGYISDQHSGQGGPERGLRRTRAALDALGAPDRHYPIVHIAGSKGKGSTAAFVASIGRAAGDRTGLFTSPHLHSFRERIAIDGGSVDETVFAGLAFTCARAIDQLEREQPELGRFTAFELLTVMGLLAFAESACDLGVVEVGLGGSFDSTNAITPAVAIITRLDLEHTQILGESIEEIATNKAGIIEPSVPVITAAQVPAAMAVIDATATRLNAPLFVYRHDFSATGTWQDFTWTDPSRTFTHLRSGMAGPHQMENAALAIAAWQRLPRAGREASDRAVRVGLETASLPGRFERITAHDRHWILDGAHTPVAASALAIEVLAETGGPVVTIAGFLDDKHPEPFLEALAPAISASILTAPRNPRALAPESVVQTAPASIARVELGPNLETALRMAKHRTPPALPILITGSLALVAEARELLGLAMADPPPG